MGTLVQDIRFGMRMLVKHPVVTAVALIALALGIGANTAVFSVMNSLMLRPLPVHDAGRLTVIALKIQGDDTTIFPIWTTTTCAPRMEACPAFWPTIRGSSAWKREARRKRSSSAKSATISSRLWG